jgi:hypothetical protein
MACCIDHITITSPSLEVGSEWVHERLGVRPQRGGEHPRMGTHNLLLRLGDSMFLEVIAVNAAAPAPSRARWFELDALAPEAEPRLACWVVRTADIRASVADASEALGVVEPMSRGHLEWLISIPEDGSLPLGGVGPTLIQWPASTHPAVGLQDRGCQLVALELLHPHPARVRELLRRLGVVEPGVSVSVCEAGVPGLVAHIRTPLGLRTIGGTLTP